MVLGLYGLVDYVEVFVNLGSCFAIALFELLAEFSSLWLSLQDVLFDDLYGFPKLVDLSDFMVLLIRAMLYFPHPGLAPSQPL